MRSKVGVNISYLYYKIIWETNVLSFIPEKKKKKHYILQLTFEQHGSESDGST